MQDPTLIVGA